MLQFSGQNSFGLRLIGPSSHPDTIDSTTGWLDISMYSGDLMFVLMFDQITGTLTPTVEHASDIVGTDAALVVFNEGPFITMGNTEGISIRTVRANSLKGFIRFIGTIVGGPAEFSACMIARHHGMSI
jgi:hypothetical protein